MNPTFDADGYPTDETLDVISSWDCTDFYGLMEYIQQAWHWPEYCREVRPGLWRLVTGGWSGNEEIIGAIRCNAVWWLSYWLLSKRGGLHTFKAFEHQTAARNQ